MRTKLTFAFIRRAALLLLSTISPQLSTFAQGTALTYQGRLNDGGAAAHGTYDLRFKLFQDSFGNTQAGGTVLVNGVPMTNGLFTATLDFGAGIFNGSNYWLEVDVRTNGGGSYANLNPLQAVTPSPYAIFANTASNLSGTVSSANLSGTYSETVIFNSGGNNFSGSGSGLTSLNAANISSGTVADARLSANVAFLNSSPVFAGDISLSGGAAYHHLQLSGGNAQGYLYGSYPAFGDGIHLGYNWYADGSGFGHVSNTGGATSRLLLGYGIVGIYVGIVNGTPTDERLIANITGVGINRSPAANALEVEGNASKTVAGSWLANSDARIKTGVHTLTNALSTLARVRLVRFHYTDEYRAAHPGIADREYLNVVAQEFQEVFPEQVQHSGEKLADGDDILQVDAYPLTIYSAAAVQELNQKVEGLRSELNRRDAENAALRHRLDALEKIALKQQAN